MEYTGRECRILIPWELYSKILKPIVNIDTNFSYNFDFIENNIFGNNELSHLIIEDLIFTVSIEHNCNFLAHLFVHIIARKRRRKRIIPPKTSSF